MQREISIIKTINFFIFLGRSKKLFIFKYYTQKIRHKNYLQFAIINAYWVFDSSKQRLLVKFLENEYDHKYQNSAHSISLMTL